MVFTLFSGNMKNKLIAYVDMIQYLLTSKYPQLNASNKKGKEFAVTVKDSATKS